MRREEPLRVTLLRMLRPGIAGTIMALLLTWPLLLLKGQIGIQAILFGGVLWLLGAHWGWNQARLGAPSQIGPTSSLEEIILLRPMPQQERPSQPAACQQSGKPPFLN